MYTVDGEEKFKRVSIDDIAIAQPTGERVRLMSVKMDLWFVDEATVATIHS